MDCGGPKEDPILALSAEESLELGRELMEKKKYSQAREYLSHAFEVAPNSASGREALLLVADAFYLDGGSENFVRAEGKYRDFLNRFPTSDRAAYVQLQLAKSLSKRALRPDRDQSATRQALEAFNELMQLYPDSQNAEEGRQQIAELRSLLAQHELIIGRYNYRRRLYAAAISRLEGLIETYPEFVDMDRALFYLGQAYQVTNKTDKAQETLERLRTESPDSPYLAQLSTKLDKSNKNRKNDQKKNNQKT